jgi:SAM-dependent methyltransferase
MKSEERSLLDRMRDYTFYHCVPIDEATTTPGVEAIRVIQQPVLRWLGETPLEGKRVLDIGCRDGLFSFAAERSGASEIIGIDNDLSRAAVEFLIPVLKSRVTMHQMNLLDLTPSTFGKFDVIIFAGVLYHLRYPFWALKVIRDVMVPGATMLLETAFYRAHEDEALLHCPVGEESPYEPTSVTFYNRKGLVDTLASLGFETVSVELLDVSRPIDRGTLVCRYAPDTVAGPLDRYWHATHDRHTHRRPGADKKERSRDLLA